MPGQPLPALLDKLQQLTREQIALDGQVAEVRRQILGAGTATGTRAAPRPKKRPHSIGRGASEVVKATLRVLQEAGAPLARIEVAKRLGIAKSAAAFRLKQAVAMGFARRVGRGFYECTPEVPAL